MKEVDIKAYIYLMQQFRFLTRNKSHDILDKFFSQRENFLNC